MTDIKHLDHKNLSEAFEGSYYFISGTGGDLQEWVDGYHGLMDEEGISRPEVWYQTTGASVNMFASNRSGYMIHDMDLFPDDLVCLLFPLTGMGQDIGRLALFKIRMQDRWFDDVVANMVRKSANV